jgi:Dyp-type peroxidase family
MSAGPAPALERLDIQGNILKPYNLQVARYIFLRVNDVAGGRRLIAALTPWVTSSAYWSEGKKPAWTLNLAFTHTGLAALGTPQATLATFPDDFKEGMAARAGQLWDKGESAPAHWEPLWRDRGVHVWASFNAQSTAVLDERHQWLRDRISEANGVTALAAQDAAQLVVGGRHTRKEHFGFTDGFGDPEIAGSGFPPVPGRGKWTGHSWEPLAPGEFLLGYVDESGAIPAAPLPAEFSRNGTFMVYRKLHQNVASFRCFVRDAGASLAGGPDRLAARIVGRWPDGTSLEMSPACPDPALAHDTALNNDFVYGADANGNRCPLGAHIRRANPRDALGSPLLVNRHRIMRRGVPYGEWIPPSPDNAGGGTDEGNHGMIFMALNASIERQFEFVNREWLNYGNDFGLGNDKDILTGQRQPDDTVVVQGNAASFAADPPVMFGNLSRFVVLRGGDYFFIPSLSALRMLASGSIDAS